MAKPVASDMVTKNCCSCASCSTVEYDPTPLLKAAAAVASLVERWDFQFAYPAETLRLMAGTTWIGSSAKAQHALGFTARPLEEGLRHTVEHELRQLGMA